MTLGLSVGPTQIAVAASSRTEDTTIVALPGKVRVVCSALELYGRELGQDTLAIPMLIRAWAWPR